ncbi:uncharacterized protein LOC129003530 [Macrosteles quadrilineatus]|uniref:uncharacterized protein LOC129003530 n=1 Tax=Macrosteles quadrilineatus TaxID=74068 RepID=UPI0023E33229|nr:uncharacterized protein LOC129003530 [Macrosteles quadrilineatus]
MLGDANGKIGQEPVWKGTAGGNSLHKESNDNGMRLLSLAVGCDMRVMSTFFPRQDIYKATWVSPDGHSKNQIDHVLIDRRHSSHITNVRTIRGAECGSDHYLVLVKVKQRICIEKRKGQEIHESIAVEKLREKDTAKEFKIKLSNRFQILEEQEQNDKLTIEERWTSLRNTIQKCAEEVCGKKKRSKNKPWFDEDCRTMINERKQAKDVLLKHGREIDRRNYEIKAKETVKILRRKKRE